MGRDKPVKFQFVFFNKPTIIAGVINYGEQPPDKIFCQISHVVKIWSKSAKIDFFEISH